MTQLTSAGATFAVSQRTLADLRRLAEQSPREAETYLRGVAARLPPHAANPLQELLGATGSLTDRLREYEKQLGQVFAPAPNEWGAVQAARAGTLGWAPNDQPATILTGKVHLAGDRFIFESPGLKPLQLAEGAVNDTLDGIPGQWMLGLIRDMELRLQGTLGNDGVMFNVTGFAPAKPGYETFTMARVNVAGDDLFLRTAQGERIELSNPALREQLTDMHRLAVILPGSARDLGGGKKAYERNPSSFFALGRFRETALQRELLSGTMTGYVDMAHEAMKSSPVRLPPSLAGRVSHTWRVWLEGAFRKGTPGEQAAGFDARYISEMTDTTTVEKWTSVPLLPKVPAAGALDAARELAAP